MRSLVFAPWVLLALCFGCNSTPTSSDGGPVGPPGPVGYVDAGQGTCGPCVSSTDCHSGSCVQIGADDFCGASCVTVADCASDQSCTAMTSAEGHSDKVCVPRSGSCSPVPTCPVCSAGFECDVATGSCVAGPDAGPGVPPANDGGPGPVGPPVGTVGVNGGQVSRLFFAVVGDTRPALPDATSTYPTAVIEKIYADIEAMSPRPQFVVGTGDYMFALPFGNQGQAQADLYTHAAKQFTGGPMFAALGNHECTGGTTANCFGNTTSKNYSAYLATFVAPLGKSLPYYSVPFTSTDGSWTAKLLIVACNAWSPAQKSWMEAELARPTTYTFVARHQPFGINSPCSADADALMNQYPYNLHIVGHSHTYTHQGKQVIVGNGGAPISGNTPFGYATIEQLPTGGFKVSQYDANTALPLSAFVVP